MASLDDYVNLVQAAQMLGIHSQSLRRLIKQGRIPAVHFHDDPTAPWLLERTVVQQFKNGYTARPGKKVWQSGRLFE